MKPSSKSLHNRLIRHLREWHRKLGIIAAFFLIFLSLSGIALNHTDMLSLAHKPIKNTLLLDHYGISPPSDVRFYQQNALQVTNNLLWFNDKLLLEGVSHIVAATFISLSPNSPAKTILAVSDDNIYLFNQEGDLIDQLGEALGVPQNIRAVSVDKHSIIVSTPSGYYQTNHDFFEWQDVNFIVEPTWIMPTQAPEKTIAHAVLAYRSQFLTLERIVLDAHSGRILGLFGVLFMDAVAILLILLSLSGIYIWIRYARAKR
ncbi:MAG: PepSY domain-containing protein [Colwellia sp.]|nr:PepSY domain-containing protein [Colwellia sp.]MCW8864738.1 PepSY domain-containing protein [Colwellia sp.]MCW9081891.1 PepSY domain-containing protein [Colwellia sp.]